MKIRSDFVTNSSSSSFVVDLKLRLSDDTTVSISAKEESGDGRAQSCSFEAKNSYEKTIVSCEYDTIRSWYRWYESVIDPNECPDPDECPYTVDITPVPGSLNLNKIRSATSLKTLIAAITEPFGLNHHVTFEKIGDEANFIEQLQVSFNAMVDQCENILSNHLTNVSDLKETTVSMEFSGYGECLASPEEILERIFGFEQSNKIICILDEDDDEYDEDDEDDDEYDEDDEDDDEYDEDDDEYDEDDEDDDEYDEDDVNNEDKILKKLHSLKCLKNFSDKALSELIHFWKNCDYSPAECNVTQTLHTDGTIDLTVTWDEDYD